MDDNNEAVICKHITLTKAHLSCCYRWSPFVCCRLLPDLFCVT